MRRTALEALAIALAATLAFGAACNDGGSAGQTATLAPTVAATHAPTAPAGITGIAELDPIIEALRSGDLEQIRSLIAFAKLPCAPFGLGAPLCAPGEAEGTLVDSFVIGRCEGVFYRSHQIDEVVGAFAGHFFYAVYGATPSVQFADLRPVEYVAIAYATYDGTQVASQVRIARGRIVGLSSSCPPEPPAQFAETLGLGAPLLPAQVP